MHLPQKFLVQMSGAPGSGKSTIANLLAPKIDGIIVNHDLIKTFFLENGNGIGFNQSAKLTYDFQWILAKDLIQQGRSVIIDSTCNYDEIVDQGTMLAQQHGYCYRYIECRVNDIDLLDQRLRNRVSIRSQRAGVDCPPRDAIGIQHNGDHRALLKKWIEKPCRPAGNVTITVDSTLSTEECLEYILKQIVISAGAEDDKVEEALAKCSKPSIATGSGETSG